uniref:VWFA domain-containing protein n=1 Tax=Acrobeloides nanus TaxID=290746 RepID=A0A914E3K3_9BILA
MSLLTKTIVGSILLFIAFCFVSSDIFPSSCELNVLIVLDRSDSVKGGFNRSRDFVLNASQELNIGPHAHSVAVIAYSGKRYPRQILPWNFAKNNEEFYKKVKQLRSPGGTTATREALLDAYVLMESRNKSIPNVIMVVTDGQSQDVPTDAARKLQ